MYIILDAYLGSLGLSVGFRELKHAHFWDADGNRKRTFRVLRPYCLTVCYTTHLWWSVIVLVWRQVKMENSSLPVAVCVSKTRVLKLPIVVSTIGAVSEIDKRYSAANYTTTPLHSSSFLTFGFFLLCSVRPFLRRPMAICYLYQGSIFPQIININYFAIYTRLCWINSSKIP